VAAPTRKPDRDAEIVRIYREEHLTYAAIGRKFHPPIARQRVQAILEREGALDSARKRSRSDERRDDAERVRKRNASARLEIIDREVGVAIRGLLEVNVAPVEIARRLTILGRSVTSEEVRLYARERRLPIPVASSDRFSDELLRLTMMAAASEVGGLAGSFDLAVSLAASDLEALRSVCSSPEEAEVAAGLAGATRECAADLLLSKAAYDRWRLGWLSRFPKEDEAPWPPTSQTMWHRYGSWNAAVVRAGLIASDRGRPAGLIVYAESDYDEAAANFYVAMVKANRRPTIQEYDRWQRDRPVPSSASLRTRFGSWGKVINVARVAIPGLDAPLTRMRVLESDAIVDGFLDELEAIRRDLEAAGEEHTKKAEQLLDVRHAVAKACGEMVSSFESFRRRWILAAAREDPSNLPKNLASDGQATSGERRAWESVGKEVTRAAVDVVIDSFQLDKLLGGAEASLTAHGGWLAGEQRARLSRIEDVDSLRWRVLKFARNAIEHESDKAIKGLRVAISALDPAVEPHLASQSAPNTPARVVRWLATRVGPPTGHDTDRSVHAIRLAHLHVMLHRVASTMRSDSR
jgi:hypothetical protein